MKGIRKKQIVVLLLVAVVIAAGVLQYNYNNPISDVSGDGFKDVSHVGGSGSEDGAEAASSSKEGASVQANSYFAQARLDRDIEYSKNTSYFKQLSTDPTAEDTIQKQAYEQFVSIMEESECKSRIESMIKEKDFEDVFVAFANDGSVDVVIKTPSLTQSQVAQISDIVARQGNVELSKIHIRPVY